MSNYVNLLDIVYPIGSVYISTSSVSPANTVGGTWEKIKGKFLKSVDDAEVSLSTGGSDSHFHKMVMILPEYYGWSNVSGNDSGGWFPTAGLVDMSRYYRNGVNKNDQGLEYCLDRWYVFDSGNNCFNYINDNIMRNNTATQTAPTHAIYQKSTTSTESTLPPYINVYMYYRIA